MNAFGLDESTQRTVKENSRTLGFNQSEFEEEQGKWIGSDHEERERVCSGVYKIQE